ncbi:MAG: ferredoxin [Deltaproteobacteria bacterium]|nr:ferredoxin [Deltaproteobacteria bacterium]
MKVIANMNICEANAKCMEQAPEVFNVDEDDEMTVLQETITDPELQEKVRRAVARCPRAALSIEE